MSDVVITQRQGRALTIMINRPERRNALNDQVVTAIVQAIDGAEADPEVRVIVLTGAGDRAFCAGGDLEPGADGTPFTISASQPGHLTAALFRRMNACRLPLVARVNGHALAGGLGLVCACDLAVAAETATFGVPETKVGLFPMMILPFLLRNTPNRVLMEMCITGEPISAQEALGHGMLNHVVPAAELDAKVDWLVGRIADKSPTGIRMGKHALRQIREMSAEQALEYAPMMLATMARSEDAREGFAAFKEKRRADWTGR
ncbi:MAG: enoyl-CoA hydratase/isomerase family protein [Pseudooceanicola sp.]|nr:enoyl-CoA hydratase/isomerase family protein [Pseudooceanicola sp.]